MIDLKEIWSFLHNNILALIFLIDFLVCISVVIPFLDTLLDCTSTGTALHDRRKIAVHCDHIQVTSNFAWAVKDCTKSCCWVWTVLTAAGRRSGLRLLQ